MLSFFFFFNSMHLWIYLLLYRAWGYYLYHLSGFKAVVCLLVFFLLLSGRLFFFRYLYVFSFYLLMRKGYSAYFSFIIG